MLGLNTRKAGSNPAVKNPAPVVGDDHRVVFHLEEFKALKAEIAELVKVTWANLQYAILASGAIIGWAGATDKSRLETLFKWAASSPLMLSIAFGLLTIAAYIRIYEIQEYLKKIEAILHADDLGWEAFFESKKTFMAYFHLFAWGLLLLGDIAFAGWALSLF